MISARRVGLELFCNGVPFNQKLVSWEYTDNLSGQSDDLIVGLEDKESLWTGPLSLKKGDSLQANLITSWNEEMTKRNIGSFEIDTFGISSNPSQVRMESLAIPESSSIRKEGRFQAWEKATLKKVADDISKRHSMKLYFDVYENPEQDRVEQNGESDIALLFRLCSQEGLALKITNGSIVIYDEYVYERAEAKGTIQKGDSNINDYSGETSLIDTYRACKVTYQPTDKKNPITYTFVPPKAPSVGKTLVVNEQVKNQTEAERVAKKRLRNENKNETKMRFTLSGTTDYYASMTINIKGFGIFDGKYIITQMRLKVGTKTETELELRKCLEGY